MNNTNFRTWIEARKLKNVENDTQNCMTWKIAKNTENMKNEKCTRQDLDYGEKTEKPVK